MTSVEQTNGRHRGPLKLKSFDSLQNSRLVEEKPIVKTEKPIQKANVRFSPKDYAGNIREFAFPDGRPISVHKHCVNFATPLKDDPENLTLVAVKGGEKPVPLRIVYADFMAWWKASA